MKKIILLVLLFVLAFCMVSCRRFITPTTSDDNSSSVYEFTPVEPVTDGGNYSVVKQ